MCDSLILCRTCNSQRQKVYLNAKDLNQAKSNESFTYYRCNDCGSLFIYPVPSNLSFYYGQDYPAYTLKNSREVESHTEYLEQAKLNIVKRYVSSGRLIEIGPAAGRFLTTAKQAGYNVLAIEQDAGCVSHIKDTLNIEVIFSNNPSDALLKLTSSIDVIVAWHVIEHLENLREFVSAAANALRKPNGRIILSAPNPESWSFRVFGRFWVHLDAPRHLTLIPPKSLDALMAEYGLEKVACFFDDPVSLHLNRLGWKVSLMNLSRNKKLRWPLLAALGKILSIAMLLLDRLQGKGAAYTAIYK